MKFNICCANPPFGDQETGTFMDIAFTSKCYEFCNVVISIFPNKIDSGNSLMTKLFDSHKLKEVELVESSIFGIKSFVTTSGIYTITKNETYDGFDIKFGNKIIKSGYSKDERTFNSRVLETNEKLGKIVSRLEPLRKKLIEENGDMCDDVNGVIYEENKAGKGKPKQIKLERVKEYLKSEKYKYCLYKGSFNHEYDPVQEYKGGDPYKLFNGQICWLMNKENIKNNVKYWMECPLVDLWKKWHNMGSKAAGCFAWKLAPSLNFDIDEKDFKRYVDSLNDFTDEEITTLMEFNVHNADKL